MKSNQFIPSVNYHLWEPCNMRCKFCFATFKDVKQHILPRGHLPQLDAIKVVEELARFGFEKITFAGGEPTLCPWLPQLIESAKRGGMTTMIVTNGSKIDQSFLSSVQPNLDWIALSIDSLDENTNLMAGRALVGKQPLNAAYYLELTKQIKDFGFGLKINTVVNRTNFQQNLSDFILSANPKRWKILQVLPIQEQNDFEIDKFIINSKEFNHFVETHLPLSDSVVLVPETNQNMKGSYVMVDPAGRFFDNALGKHNYSNPILEIGLVSALEEVNLSFERFIDRGGIYNWVDK